MKDTHLSVKDLRESGRDKLLSVNSDINLAQLEADIILLNTLKFKDRSAIYVYLEEIVSKEKCVEYFEKITTRILGYPLAYVINKKEFYGIDYYVDDSVLIPRPETELLVEKALEVIINAKDSVAFVDIGTGSGCLFISVLKTLSEKLLLDKVRTSIASDVSNSALEVAKKNCSSLLPRDINFELYVANLLDEKLFARLKSEREIVITANLPYIDIEDPETEAHVREHEPHLALFSDKEGYSHIFSLLSECVKLFNSLESINKSLTLLLEIGYKQASRIESEAILRGFRSVEIFKDLSDKPRMLVCKM